MSSSRQRLAALIEPMLPEKWRRIEAVTVKSLGTLDGPRVFIDYITIGNDGVPPGQLIDGFEVALVSNLTDYAKAEDELDAAAQQFVRALDTDSEVMWSGAVKRPFGQQQYLGWIVTVQLLTPVTFTPITQE